ncbi:MAG: CocE/NonD family hydrolase [Deltaproteobacteria bacterium]|nr:CocE/NonD family hydrolase [Deltaproteobacteria bacterium]
MEVNKGSSGSSDSPPSNYHPESLNYKMVQEKDVRVPMRDGVTLCVDIYRPDAPGKFPALLAIAPHNKDLQTPQVSEALPPQPAWSTLWQGAMEAGDSEYLVARGYAHIIGNERGFGKSGDGGSSAWDFYDLIEWIAVQDWCDGNVGMIGISAYGGAQLQAALEQPPHLKAIFPYDPRGTYGDRMFIDRYPGGVLHTFYYLLDHLAVHHGTKGIPGPLSPEKERLWEEAVNNPDFKMYGHIYNVLVQRGQHMPMAFDIFLNPYDTEEGVRKVEAGFEKIKIPVYTGAGWYAYTYKQHLQGCQNWFRAIKGVPKKLMLTGPAHLERPFHSFHDEILRWYDHWLKGIDTGIMDEPPVKVWVMGANQWYDGTDWPLPETEWTQYYLHSWQRLRKEPFTRSSREAYAEPDGFLQMPPTQTNAIQRLRYMTEPLSEDTLMIGPIVLYLYASIDQEDTNWIIILKDVGPDVSVQTAREGETEAPADLHERELTRGWLKASHRALDLKRSTPWKPWHPLTREAQKPVVPGEINEYAIEIFSTANLFKKGHRICVDITSLDLPTGTAGLTNVEYIPYHICSSKTTVHKIYHNLEYPSHLLLPIIPKKK